MEIIPKLENKDVRRANRTPKPLLSARKEGVVRGCVFEAGSSALLENADGKE